MNEHGRHSYDPILLRWSQLVNSEAGLESRQASLRADAYNDYPVYFSKQQNVSHKGLSQDHNHLCLPSQITCLHSRRLRNKLPQVTRKKRAENLEVLPEKLPHPPHPQGLRPSPNPSPAIPIIADSVGILLTICKEKEVERPESGKEKH